MIDQKVDEAESPVAKPAASTTAEKSFENEGGAPASVAAPTHEAVSLKDRVAHVVDRLRGKTTSGSR